MNKGELIKAISTKAGACSDAEAGRCLDAFISIVKNALKKGDKVTIAGFGTFSVSKRKARTGVNPQTGAKLQIPAMKVPKFKAGSNFKKVVK
jgi:DNA-binding protein HU-beta